MKKQPMRFTIFLSIIFIISCRQADNQQDIVIVLGKTAIDVAFISIGNDTIFVQNGTFSDTLYRENSQYNYLQLNTWKWPRIIYLTAGNKLDLDFEEDLISAENDVFNEYLLNKDSILIPYSAKWDMTDSDFRDAWRKEFPANMSKIDHFFAGSSTPEALIDEVKQMELMLRGHLVANFVSFQERKGKKINRDIYDFVDRIEMNNERLAFHESNRNFQYYYFIDKVSDEIPGSIYPFAIIDTVKKHVSIPEIKSMIIRNVVKSGLYNESVDHAALFKVYEESIGELSTDDKIVLLYEKIQLLKEGKKAPEFGNLLTIDGEELAIEDFKGRNILLSAWGTWCPYCKEELPHIKRLVQKYSDKFENVAVSLDVDSEAWQEYIKINEWEAVHLIDSNRESEFRKNYLISGTNVHFLIDKKGVIIASRIKPSDEKLEALIKGLD